VSVAAAAATPEANDEAAKKEEEARKEQEEGLRGLLDTLRARLQDHVKDVRLSSRLTESPACLVGDPGDISPPRRELVRRPRVYPAPPARAAPPVRAGGAGGQAHARAERVAPNCRAPAGPPR